MEAGVPDWELLQLSDYEIVEYMGNSSNGYVYSARNLTNGNFALLRFLRGQDVKDREGILMRVGDRFGWYCSANWPLERAVMMVTKHLKLIGHDLIVEVLDITATTNHVVLHLENCWGGTLQEFLTKKGRVDEGEARVLFRQIMLAIDYSHTRNISNGNITPSNVVFKDDSYKHVKLDGYGSQLQEPRDGDTSCSSSEDAFKAPEVMERNIQNSTAIDIWSAGVTLFVMIFGKLPFAEAQSSTSLKEYQIRFPSDLEISGELEDLLKRMITADPGKRPTSREVLAHKWVRIGLSPERVHDLILYNQTLLIQFEDELKTEYVAKVERARQLLLA